jgi:hypothetical protein
MTVPQYRSLFQCCGFGIIPDLGSRILKQQQNRRGKNFFDLPFIVATNITKLKITLFLNRKRKKCEPIYKEF